MRLVKSLEARFWAKVEKTDTCWLWTGGCGSAGYGRIRHGERGQHAHRLSWQLHQGPIPDGMCVLHRCDTPPCVNPAHLFLGTKGDNARDKTAKGRHPAQTNPDAYRAARRGAAHARARLTEAQVVDIRRRFGHSMASASALADEFGVQQRTVLSIAYHRSWRHVAPEVTACGS